MEKFLEGKAVTDEELQKIREELEAKKEGKKLVEVTPGQYKVLTRFKE